MANVQPENGYTKIAHEILENMAKVKLSPTQYRMIFVIWRFTYGFQRKEHDMSLTFLVDATDCDKRQIQRDLKRLEERNIIKQNIKNGSFRRISFNKNYDQWDSAIGETTNGKNTVGETTDGETTNPTIGETTNRTIGETTNQDIYIDKSKDKKKVRSKLKFETHHMQLAELLFKKMKENNPNAKDPNFKSWANTFRLMMDRDKREGKDIQDLILWSQSDSFWYKNILSADKLREQFDRLQLEMNDENKKTYKDNVIQIPNYGGESNEGSYGEHPGKLGNVKLYKG